MVKFSIYLNRRVFVMCNWSADYHDCFTFEASRYTSAFKLRYYGNHEICMVRAYLIIYVYNLNGYQNIVYSE